MASYCLFLFILTTVYHNNIICLPGQPGDVFSPVLSLAEKGDYYEYIM